MNKNNFKISAKYWESLNNIERIFFQSNACNDGVSLCKKVLSMVNLFCDKSRITEIINADQVTNEFKNIPGKHYFLIDGNKILYSIVLLGAKSLVYKKDKGIFVQINPMQH